MGFQIVRCEIQLFVCSHSRVQNRTRANKGYSLLVNLTKNSYYLSQTINISSKLQSVIKSMTELQVRSFYDILRVVRFYLKYFQCERSLGNLFDQKLESKQSQTESSQGQGATPIFDGA